MILLQKVVTNDYKMVTQGGPRKLEQGVATPYFLLRTKSIELWRRSSHKSLNYNKLHRDWEQTQKIGILLKVGNQEQIYFVKSKALIYYIKIPIKFIKRKQIYNNQILFCDLKVKIHGNGKWNFYKFCSFLQYPSF